MANFILEDLKQIFGKRNNILSQIIVLNVAVFIVFNIIENFYPISNWFALPGTFGEYILKFWTLISYMFLHGGFFHILFNMLWLYWMGQILLEYLGAKKFTAIYFFGGIAGGAAFLIINQVLVSTAGFPLGIGLVGASAGVMAVVFAVATLLPEYQVRLMFIGPVKMKYLAIGSLILTSLLDFSVNTGGKIAHFGGAFFGFLFIRALQKGKDYSIPFYQVINAFKKPFLKKKPIKVAYKSPKPVTKKTKSNTQDQVVIDSILDKISKSGYDSLSKEEKEILFKMSKD